MQPEVDAAGTMYHQEAAVEEQQEAETVKSNMITRQWSSLVRWK
jgi:hypothetical protein